jgi:hypothetical protein
MEAKRKEHEEQYGIAYTPKINKISNRLMAKKRNISQENWSAGG